MSKNNTEYTVSVEVIIALSTAESIKFIKDDE